MAFGDYLSVAGILLTVLGLMATILLSPLYGDLVQDGWAWFGSKIKRRGKIRLAGKWKEVWHVQSKNFAEKNSAEVTIKQIGTRIEGAFVGDNQQEYAFVGRIEGNYVTGTWSDRQQGNVYWGAFQLHIHQAARRMSGKWIGFSSGDPVSIQANDWFWERLG